MQLHIRTAEATDLDPLQEVFRRASLNNAGDRDALVAHPDALVLSPVAVREQRTRMAVVDGVIAGFATVQRVGDAFELEDLFVDPDWMRKGIGLALVRDAVSLARAQGVTRIEVTANPHALAFYQRAGFVPAGTTETRFGPAPRMRLDASG